jgi:heptosyltransferase I
LFLRALVGVLRYVASRKRIKEFQPSSIKSILIIELSRLGDAILMLQSVARIKSLFPTSSMRILVDQRFEPLLSLFDIKAEIIGVKSPKSLIGLVRAVRTVRSHPVDLAISMSTPRKNALVALSTKSQFKLGYLSYLDSFAPYLFSTAIESFGFKSPVTVRFERENIYERPEKICKVLGMESEGESHTLGIKPDISEEIHNRLVQRNAIPRNHYVVIHPFSGWEFRNWNLGKFIALARKIISDLEYDVVITCEENDVSRVNKPGESIPGLHVFVSSDLGEVAELLRGAALAICNDSGPLHLAAALNVRTVGLFGPAGPALTAPSSANATYMYRRLDCSPCDQRKCVRPEQTCMSLINVDEAYAATVQTLALAANG